MPKVSIIIPIYNAEQYIERCLRSLLEQTLYDIEYIFINDASTDNSIAIFNNIIKQYPKRAKQIKIIHNSQNLGQGKCRTIGMKLATGDYLAACDADDWVEIDMFEKMYHKGVSCNSDIVVCEYYRECKNKQIHEIVENPQIPFKSLLSTSFFTLWCRLIKRELIQKHNIYPFEGVNMLEDMGVVARVYHYANTLSIINEPLYHYNKTNENSTSSKSLYKISEMRKCIDLLERFFVQQNISAQEFLDKNKLTIKLHYLQLNDFRSYKLCYPEINNYILTSPNLSKLYGHCCYLAAIGPNYPLKVYTFVSKLLCKIKSFLS